jgi:hypothetical protein
MSDNNDGTAAPVLGDPNATGTSSPCRRCT